MYSSLPVSALRQAVVIGVNDYAAPPPGCASLRAPVNDVAHWVRVLLGLAVPPERITVLTSPVLRPEDLVPIGVSLDDARALTLGVADTEGVNAAASELRTRVAQGGESAQTVLAFTGHGGVATHTGAFGLLADYTGGGPESGGGLVARDGVLHLRALHHAAAGPRGRASILSVLDVCREDGARIDGAAEPQGLVLLSTTRAGGRTSERRIDGAWRSQGSWALQVVLEQWPTIEEAGSRYVGISYERLAHQADALMRVFAVDGEAQTMEIVHGAGAQSRTLGERAFLHVGAGGGRTCTSPVAGVAHNLPATCRTSRRWMGPGR